MADRYYPYNGIPNSPKPGYMIEIAQYALAKSGHTVKYQLMPWGRAIEQVRRGEKDCIIAGFKSDAPSFIFPELNQGVDQIAFYSTTGNQWQYTGVDSLRSIRLGIIESYSYQDDVDVYIQQANASPMIKARHDKFALENNLMGLIKGDLDVIVESRPVVESTLKKLNLADKIQYVGAADKLGKNYIACSPVLESSKEYAQLISDATAELRQNGQLEKILAKYGLRDWVDSGAVDN